MKRSNEEFSTTVVEEQLDSGGLPQLPQPTLQLKRAKKLLTPARLLIDQIALEQDTTPAQDLLRLVVNLERELPLESLDEVELAVRCLWDRVRDCENVVLRAKMVSLLGSLARQPGANAHSVMDEMIRSLATEKSHKVMGQLLYSLRMLGRLFANEGKLVQSLVNLAIEHLKDSHHSVRCQCLRMIGELACADTTMGGTQSMQSLVASFAVDSDSRVRTTALQALLALHERGQKLDMMVYEQASKALHDDYEEVRMVAIKLLWVFSHICPERTVILPSSDEARLVDDAFIKICHMVNDMSMQVRGEAVGLLGSLHHVSPKFLEQTLDKKVMSHLKRRKTDHEKQRDRFAGGGSSDSGWSTGRQWGDKMSSEGELAPEEVSLMSSGACGAFVHGLEDEYLEVRMPAVDALCELANQNPSFAMLCLDFLVDMFNDEIESVRLNAINSLRKVCHQMELREDQLDIVLSVLEDFSHEIREGVRELLGHCHLSTRACLHSAIHALLSNLSKYPQDRASIWRCAQQLGKKHQHLASSLVPELLSTHPYFATAEPSVDDPAYVAIVILVFNATVNSPVMIPMFPSHTLRHYGYLRDSYPDLVPQLPIEGEGVEVELTPQHQASSGESFMCGILRRVESLTALSPLTAQKLLKTLIKDLKHAQGISKSLSSNSRCIALYLESHLIILQAQIDKLWDTPGALCSAQGTGLQLLVEQLLTKTYRIEHCYHGLSSAQLLQVHELRLLVHALLILSSQRCDTRTEKNLGSTLQVWQSFLSRVKHFSSFLRRCGAAMDDFCESIMSFQTFFESNITKPAVIAEYLQTIVLTRRPAPLQISSMLRESRAVMAEPQGGSENPRSFSAGLTLGIDIDAMLEDLPDPSNLRIQVVFPDMRRQLFTPKTDDFQHLSDMRHRLVTTVVVSHSGWSESCFIELSLVLKYMPDIDEDAVVIPNSPHEQNKMILRQVKNSTDSLQDGVLGLCPPVRLCIQPKPGK
ncbi:integrator complex subunit 4 isoform X2 [Nematostella vectensis]|uniref:integrator complex subunit 4 isoform X2 n=2 Tax=Nematostella vectensis TaxID=45351 RepID=UPI002076DCB6|nr:integrator complex subunit 4 isoform X2 [Nematostella vectensis]